MIKGIVLSLLLVCFAGCGSVGDLYHNMLDTNEKMEANIVVLSDVKETVLENQFQVVRSTNEIKQLAEVNGENMEVIKNTMAVLGPFDVHKLAGLGLLLLLFVPCLILAFSYFSLPRKR